MSEIKDGGPALRHECVKWSGCIDVHGYGKKGIDGKEYYAHRLTYCNHRGISLESIKGLVVRHRCDNPSCVNPDHLVIGTQTENMRDMFERNRESRGEDRWNSVLTEKQVLEIRRDYVPRHPEFGGRALARKYGVDQSTVVYILQGKLWKHIKG